MIKALKNRRLSWIIQVNPKYNHQWSYKKQAKGDLTEEKVMWRKQAESERDVTLVALKKEDVGMNQETQLATRSWKRYWNRFFSGASRECVVQPTSWFQQIRIHLQTAGLQNHKRRKKSMLILAASSVQFSHSVMSDSLWPHGLQYSRLPCPSPTPRAYSNSCPLSR